MNNSFGIEENSYTKILGAIFHYSKIEKVMIFGSRAMGNYKKGSDIDLAILGSNVDFRTTSDLHSKLNEQLPIPYYIDVVNFNSIDNKELQEHIRTEGKVIWEREEI